MKCPNCQQDNADSAKFCIQCGEPLLSELTCTHCNHINKPSAKFCDECGHPPSGKPLTPEKPQLSQPTPFAGGRYRVKKYRGEGGKKKVYLDYDIVLDKDFAFALIKMERLGTAARTRITREVQAMGRPGDHPHIVTVYDFGDHEG